MKSEIPLVDLKAQYEAIQDEIDEAIRAVISATSFVRGPFVKSFESAFAEAIGADHCIGVGNGTDALYIVLQSMGIGPGDEVITAANSWISSSEVISQCGATPVFADVDPRTYDVNPSDVEARITERTRAVIPVHLFGHPANMPAILDIARRHDLEVLEDCAQAHLAGIDGRPVGCFGRAGTFSFYPGKNLGAYGDAGAIVTDDPALADAMRRFANHGSDPANKHDHVIEGINSRLDGIQAAILSVKLRHLEAWTEARRRVAEAYRERLDGVGNLRLPTEREGYRHVYHVFCVATPDRDGLRAHLGDSGIATGIHYPTALPFLTAYRRYGYERGDYPVAHRLQSEILSLPMYPEMTESQIDRIAGSIVAFFGG